MLGTARPCIAMALLLTEPSIKIVRGYTTNTGTMSSWTIKEGNGTETAKITNGETFTIEDGTGIQSELTSTTSGGTITITNTAPDQTVSLTGAGATTISGTYPNFTITLIEFLL